MNPAPDPTADKRATAGVSGRSRLHPAEIAIAAAAWAGVFAVMGALAGQGVVGIAGAFAGPAGAWAVAGAGAGLSLALPGSAVVVAWRQRRGVVGA